MSDPQARRNAVLPSRSMIVQAPAGSGKTTLLVERYLGLLAVVDAPEAILAITFTRKAAAEMRERVLRYLDADFESAEPHEQAPLRKAQAIRDKVEQWQLLANPHRLQIRTIDSFNQYLARSMPVASALGPVPAPADNVQQLYRRAARNVIALVEDNDDLAEDLETLLDWRDHRAQDLENLLANLLSKRDQWLRALNVTGELQRHRLEETLTIVVNAQLNTAHQALNTLLKLSGTMPDELLKLLRFAAKNLANTQTESKLSVFLDATHLPSPAAEGLPMWQGLAQALLPQNSNGQFRKTVNVKQGFAPKTEEKARFLELLAAFSEHPSCAHALENARQLPTPRYSDQQWRVLDALVRVLKRTALELELVFARAGQSDYTGLAAAALRGLGDEEQGFSDLGLYLDHRIEHILVDEFQDTNWGQLHLLEKLTAGWQPDDGRTLFLVGDPMQSIYRFREAEVGLFIRSRDQGIGDLLLNAEKLDQNFRSRQEIVDWVNAKLGPIFPDTEDISAGAVAYASSRAGRGNGGNVSLYALADEAAEAETIVNQIKLTLQQNAGNPQYKAAIIVRARSHLRAIIPALARHQIPFRAVKLDPLVSRSVVQDLLAITRSVLYPADITAVLSILRSPMCGLTLSELHTLAGDGRSIFDQDALQRLPDDALSRAQRVFSALADAQQQWRRRSVRDLVEGVWHRLGGPQCTLHPQTDLLDADIFLNVLEQAENDGALQDWNDFQELILQQQTEGDPPDDDIKLEVLTMHAAKGLEWDLVVLPGLGRRPGNREASLLHWLPFTSASQSEQMLLAPLKASQEAGNSPLIELIRKQQKAREAYENQRLLYVATTRAKERLILSATLDHDDSKPLDTVKPPAGSLLRALWETCKADFLDAFENAQEQMPTTINISLQTRDQNLRRVAAHWAPATGRSLLWHPEVSPTHSEAEVEYNWAGVHARRVGIVLHQILERIGRIGVEQVSISQRQHLMEKIPQLLRAAGSTSDRIAAQSKQIEATLTRTLESKVGRWILSNRHQAWACELPLSGFIDGQLVNVIIDRTFIDAQDVRWIIDYKSGYHAGADLANFLAEESARYQSQLSRYRRLFEGMESRQVQTALYLPRHDRLQIVPT